MAKLFEKIAIIGQGLIGSSLTRAIYEKKLSNNISITDSSNKVRKRLLELGLGAAKVVNTNGEAVKDADLVIACVPVGLFSDLTKEIAPFLKSGAILSDVGSVKKSILEDVTPHLPEDIHLVPAHPLAGAETSGPDAGLPKLFANRWCILTPDELTDKSAIKSVTKFWEALGSKVEIMSAERHDQVLAVTSHLPQLIAYSIFHTALAQEEKSGLPVIQFSAGGFKDFTRIASSNPTLWRDIFIKNKNAMLEIFEHFKTDAEACIEAIREEDGEKLEALFSKSRITRRRVIDKEHISLLPDEPDNEIADTLFRPYASGD